LLAMAVEELGVGTGVSKPDSSSVDGTWLGAGLAALSFPFPDILSHVRSLQYYSV
jgi:hypothetical protein